MLTKFELAATILASASCGALAFISLHLRRSLKEFESHHARFVAAAKKSFARWEENNKDLNEELSAARGSIEELKEEKLSLQKENKSLYRLNDALNKRLLKAADEKARLKKGCDALLDWKADSSKRIAALQEEVKAKTEEALLQKQLYEKLSADLKRHQKDDTAACKKGSKAAKKK